MAGTEVRATSFGQVADDYDRLRPSPPAEALDWLVPAGCDTAIDVAAGTGLFTRALATRVPHVTAVEPDDRMRAVLAGRSPEVQVVNGRGEAIPVPDQSADGVFVSSAWHWLDQAVAVPEIARVLRDGGRLGLIWNMRDRQVDWVADMEPRREAQPRRRWHAVTLPPDAPFEHVETASFHWTRTLTVDEVLGWMSTYSGFITAPAEQQAATRERARALLQGRAAPDGTVEIPMRADCWRADRVPR